MADAIRTRCKFRVVGVEDTEGEMVESIGENDPRYASLETYEYGGSNGFPKYKHIKLGKYCQNVRLAASYDTANPEDVSFAAATPSGELKIFVSNPTVVGTFKPGQNYYLDLVPCDK